VSIFGSQDDDLLLQNDPPDPWSEDTSSDGDEGPAPADSTLPAPSPTNAASESVFTESEPSPENDTESVDTHSILHSLDETIGGVLTELNAAVDPGWRLVRVEMRQADPHDDDLLPHSPSLAFVLRKAGA
jgi:hypothetical protein